MKSLTLIQVVLYMITTFLSTPDKKDLFDAHYEKGIWDLNENQVNLKVMAYNIHHANPPSKPHTIDIDAIIKTLQAQDPDIVALQEIDANTSRSGEGNQAEIIAERLGMNVFFGKAINYDGGEYGVAILSKYPISEQKVHSLPTARGTNGEPRVLATVKIALPNGLFIRFGSTHLDSQRTNTNRLLQMEEIANIASEENLPMIVAGDFNAPPNSKVINILDKYFTRTCASCEPTIPVQNPVKAIDFIAFKSKEIFSIKSHKVINEIYASDHLPILAVLKIKQLQTLSK